MIFTDTYNCLDTVEVMSGYVDVVVMRHPEPGAVRVSITIFYTLVFTQKPLIVLCLDWC